MISLLRYGVIFSFFLCLTALSILVVKTFSFGKKGNFARPQGDWRRGVFYAMGQGLMPWEKESAAKHLPTYTAGILYHTAIFLTLFYLASLIISFGLAMPLITLFRILVFAGLLCGIGLFLKRIIYRNLRKISCQDDFISNLIVDVFLAIALSNTFFPDIKPYFFLVAILLFIYIPLGKIRHCFFFFYVRILFGVFYGRRGVLPRGNMKSEI